MTLMLLPRETSVLTTEIEQKALLAVVGTDEMQQNSDPKYLINFLAVKFDLPENILTGFTFLSRHQRTFSRYGNFASLLRI